MISKKERYKVNLVWVMSIFLLWEFGAFFLDKVANDPMAEAKLPYPHSIIISIINNFS